MYAQPRLRKLARYYFLLPVPFVPLIPMIASDFMVMIPLSMVYMLGVGPALGIAMQKPTCPDCGAHVPKP